MSSSPLSNTPEITTAITKASSSSSALPAPPPPPSTILHLYAELLVHIRTVTLFASLRTSHTPATTRAELSADGERVTLTHEGESASIRLPARIVGGGDAALALPPAPSKDLTLRLQVREEEGGGGGGLFVGGGRTGASGRRGRERENVVPWGAGALGEEGCAKVGCRVCGEVIVDVFDTEEERRNAEEEGVGKDEKKKKEGQPGVRRWMDLPNENWAEMMDFWHCHKPHEHHLPGHKHEGSGEKGYAAGNRIMAKRGVGYVDLAYLLLKADDCKGVQPSTPSKLDQSTNPQHLICASCKTVVGVVDPHAEGWRIWKWSIAVTPRNSSHCQSYSIRKWVAAQLLYLIDNQGVRKFTVRPDADITSSENGRNVEATDPVMIWVFTPDIAFSSSIAADCRQDPTRAMKVLWKPAPAATSSPALEETASSGGAVQTPAVSGKTESQALDRESLSVEELRLPAPAFGALVEALREGGEWLPASAKEFKEWKVGLVERFGEDEV